jgi:cell division protease FtsH
VNVRKLRLHPNLGIPPYIVLMWVALSVTAPPAPKDVTTEHGIALLQGGHVAVATIDSGTQSVARKLTKPDGALGTDVQFSYVTPRGGEIVSVVNSAHLSRATTMPPPSRTG